jgi:hypothetical protein
MTVNHGVPGSSPGGGASRSEMIGFFCGPYWERSLSRCNEVKSGSPGGTLERIRIVQWTILARGEMARWQK